ncbi:hypothetical protein QD460_33630, partial [Rhizobium jaguaris]|uniref:hypothetical protein n=1 Tax=Rhizobium jaguaris TaxID=1312183 RepID=UPI0039BFFA35
MIILLGTVWLAVGRRLAVLALIVEVQQSVGNFWIVLVQLPGVEGNLGDSLEHLRVMNGVGCVLAPAE